ncbi:MAG: hypothetical protein QW707_06880 [Candidatus Bathyarchaeia archaeon]
MSVMMCPRCRQPLKAIYVKVRRGREYLYGYHGRQAFCYLGAAGKYIHVERLLNLDLTGLTFADYLEIMRRAFDRALDSALRNGRLTELKREIAKMLSEIQPEIQLPKAWANLPILETTGEARA